MGQIVLTVCNVEAAQAIRGEPQWGLELRRRRRATCTGIGTRWWLMRKDPVA